MTIWQDFSVVWQYMMNPVIILMIVLSIITVLVVVIGLKYDERDYDDEHDSGHKLEQPDK
jgi:hypothetical protein